MKTYDVNAEFGGLVGFEVSNLLIGRRGVCRLLARIPGLRITRRPRLLSWIRDDDLFCSFELEGTSFTVEEPFGDSSRYFIRAIEPTSLRQISVVRAAFRNAQPLQYVL